jgi:hypothetical protein
MNTVAVRESVYWWRQTVEGETCFTPERRGWPMHCERCGDDTHTERYDVDGFEGHLCAECVEEWEAIQATK